MKKPYLLYMLFDQNDQPFYVGITNNKERRLKEHIKDFKTKNMSKFKAVESFKMEIIGINSNKKFNIKYFETFIILWDKMFGNNILRNQYIF